MRIWCRWNEIRPGTLELILILVVLIALVLIFKSKLTALVNEIFDKITSQSRLV